MADIPSIFTKVNDIEVASDAPLTEALEFKFGGNENFLKDESVSLDARMTVLETANIQKSGVINFSTGSGAAETVIPNSQVTITAVSGVVAISLEPFSNANWSGYNQATGAGQFKLYRGATLIYITAPSLTQVFNGLLITDTNAGVGANIYELRCQANVTTISSSLTNGTLVATEID